MSTTPRAAQDFKDAQKLFLDLCAFLGEDSISEPRELFEPLANFLVRLDVSNHKSAEACVASFGLARGCVCISSC
eukprot:6141164-Pleurochrysis_carterae.AAC.1